MGFAYVLLVETNPFPELVVIFTGLFTSNIPWYFLVLLYTRLEELDSKGIKVWHVLNIISNLRIIQ